MELLLLIILITTTETVDRNTIEYFQKHQCYLKDVLASIHHSPNQLAVNRRTNSLYFSSDVDGEYVPVMLDIDSKDLRLIKGVKDAYAIASNNIDDEIYFGGSNGIHRYKPVDKTLTSLAITNLDIWWLYFKKNIYFIQFPHLNVYVYKDRTIKVVRQLKNTQVNQFVFDREGYIFFVNVSGLYGVKKFSHEHVLLRAKPQFLGMASDNKGAVFVSSDSAIYVVNKTDQKVKRVVRVPGVMAMAFDKENHLIYSDGQELVRLLAVTETSEDGDTFFCN
ncbi:ommochrome-binding protein-like [Cydia pomonella]|uniref:ommochrome-binding protein-like n=1 Tax=Cydia pomonella TaxID=82600 RepID=UPI002ADD9CEE|nr:ommochrome-binding protein-like [Cydia pomonella]